MKSCIKSAWPIIILVCTVPLGMLVACHKNVEFGQISISVLQNECSSVKSNSEIRVCYDSLTYDNRCPEGAVCGIVGHVEIKVRFFENGKPHAFKMILFDRNVHSNTWYAVSDTIIKGYKIKLDSVLPYPKVLGPLPASDEYKAYFTISQ